MPPQRQVARQPAPSHVSRGSAGAPTRDRHLASLAVVMDGRIVLFDCGERTQYQLMRAPFRGSRIEAIFITHLHCDHLYGLPGLLGTLTLHGHEAALEVYGPAGLREYLSGIFATTQLHRRPGRRIAYCLDTRPCQASVELSRGGAVLVHEATYGNWPDFNWP